MANLTQEEAIEQAIKAVLDVDEEASVKVAEDTLASGLDPLVVLQEGFTVGMRRAGELFEAEEMSLPEMIIAADCMMAALAVLETALPEKSKSDNLGTVVIGTIEGDVHDIGKTIVATLLEVSGFEVHNLGRDVPIAEFVSKAKETGANLVGSSALMTTTMTGQQKLEAALTEAGLRDKVKTMVGGAAATQGWADKIGADIYAESATEAVQRAKEAVA
ncbi:MAG: corrinoid protein [Thermoleophilia bacterium]|nr:corrinoid protein [Thermoleophilia bacterium]